MVQKVEFTTGALDTFASAIKYLDENFSENEIRKFTGDVDEKLSLLKRYPRLGTKVSTKPNTYKTVINKRIVLYYQYIPIKQVILLLAFWNTLQNPDRLKI